MAHIYEDQADECQADAEIEPSRFRPKYRQLSEREQALHDEIKAKAVELETLFCKVKHGRYNSLAMTSLEESVMWIVKQLTS